MSADDKRSGKLDAETTCTKVPTLSKSGNQQMAENERELDAIWR